jgi:putative hydrolase of the HAD superfamily
MGGTIETYSYTPAQRLDATPGVQQLLHGAGIELNLSNDGLYKLISDGLSRYHAWRAQTMQELPTRRIWCDFILAGQPVDPEALASIAEALTLYLDTRYYQRALRPEVPAALQAIQQMGLKIGLISNIASLGQVPLNLEQYGIRSYFDPLVLSSEYGWRKPDPAIFHYAARLAEVPTSACLYVGDRIARDILGARKAGYGMAVQIRHDFDHGEADDGAVPDAIIDSMTELVEIVRSALACPPHAVAAARQTQAILFDAGDVLYYRTGKGKKLAALLRELALDANNHSSAQKRKLKDLAYSGQIEQEAYREGMLRLAGMTDPQAIARGLQILDDEEKEVSFFEGVRETLLALKQRGYLLGIVTDTASHTAVKLNWLEKGGIAGLWDCFVSSKELKVRKPDPKMYCTALRQLGISPAQAIFVGHKAAELKGARAVGLRTVAFNHDRGAKADVFIDHFADLLDLPMIA